VVVPASNNTSNPSNKLSEEHAKQINNVPPLNESDFNAMPSDLQTKILNENIHQQEIQRNQDEEFKTVSTESSLLKPSVPPSADPNVLNADDLDRMDPSTRSKVLKSMLPGNPESAGSVRISSANGVDQSQGKDATNEVNIAPPAANDNQPIENTNAPDLGNSPDQSTPMSIGQNNADQNLQNPLPDPVNAGGNNNSGLGLPPSTEQNVNIDNANDVGSNENVGVGYNEADVMNMVKEEINKADVPANVKQEVLNSTEQVIRENGGFSNMESSGGVSPSGGFSGSSGGSEGFDGTLPLPEAGSTTPSTLEGEGEGGNEAVTNGDGADSNGTNEGGSSGGESGGTDSNVTNEGGNGEATKADQ
jgi:hypothetical protein